MPQPATAEYAQQITALATAVMRDFPIDSFPVLQTESQVPPFNFSGQSASLFL
jgi:hypothetical protein